MGAFVKVTECRQTSGGSIHSYTASVTSTAGNALFGLCGVYYTGANQNPTFTLSGGGTWTTDKVDNQHFTSTNDNIASALASCPSATGGTQTLTFTWGITDNTFNIFTAWVYEFSGMANPVLDAAGTGTQGAASPVTTNAQTNTNANDVMFGFGYTYSSGVETHGSPGNSWIMPAGGDETDGTNFLTGVTAYKIVSSSASQSTSWTDSPSVAWTSLIGAYKQAPVTTPVGRLIMPNQNTPGLYLPVTVRTALPW